MLHCCCTKGPDQASTQIQYRVASDAILAENPPDGEESKGMGQQQALAKDVWPVAESPMMREREREDRAAAFMVPGPPSACSSAWHPGADRVDGRQLTSEDSGVDGQGLRSDRTTASSASVLSPEEKQWKKDQLQLLVKTFAKRALQGVTCVYIEATSGARYETKYKIDKKLQTLIIVAPPGAPFSDITCPIIDIEEIRIDKRGDDQRTLFPPVVMSSLQDEERQRLLMVVHAQGNFCLLDFSAESRENFLTSMHILRRYCVGQPTGDGGQAAPGSARAG